MSLPRYIGICGHPKSGKSLVQEILQKDYGVTPVDDGEVLREFAIDYFGAQHADVYTQEGKAKLAYWPNGDPIIDDRDGSHMTWRQVLGRFGAQLEDLFGEFAMPMITCAPLDLSGGPYSFGSVRKKQGGYYRRHGGVIIEVQNPLAKPSGNDFDLYDETLVNHSIYNDGLARGLEPAEARRDLARKVNELVNLLSGQRNAA